MPAGIDVDTDLLAHEPTFENRMIAPPNESSLHLGALRLGDQALAGQTLHIRISNYTKLKFGFFGNFNIVKIKVFVFARSSLIERKLALLYFDIGIIILHQCSIHHLSVTGQLQRTQAFLNYRSSSLLFAEKADGATKLGFLPLGDGYFQSCAIFRRYAHKLGDQLKRIC